jgi:hypothetical protein
LYDYGLVLKDFVVEMLYFLGVSLRVGLYRASLRYGASTSLTAALPIPNALRLWERESFFFDLSMLK